MVRVRHPGGAYERPTHTKSPVDYGQPSDRFYGSQMDVEPVSGVDLGAGSVTDGSIVDGGLDGSTAIRPGTLPPSSGDQEPPPLPTMITVTSELVTDSAGNVTPAIKVAFVPPPDPPTDDYFGTYVEATDLNDGDPTTPAPVWLRPIIVLTGKESSTAYITGVAGATTYWVRVRAADTQGNISAYSATQPILTVSDTVPPPVPFNIRVAGGFKLIGVAWAAAAPSDLMFNEVRFAPDLNPTVGDSGPDTALWTTRRTQSNSIIIDDLLGGTFWWVQVRAVDYSRNVMARWAVTGLASTNVFTCLSHTFVDGEHVEFAEFVGGDGLDVAAALYVRDATSTTFKVAATPGGAAIDVTSDMTQGFVAPSPEAGVNYIDQPESGWTAVYGPVEAALIGAADVAFNEVIANIIATGELDADTIKAGTLTIGAAAGQADGIQIVLDGVTVGDWDETGMNIRSKVTGRSELDYLHLDSAALWVYKDGLPLTGIDKDGINASAINFGVSPGGHNLVYNSSFELSQFTVQATGIIGTGGSTFAGGVGGWTLVTNTNCTLAAAAVTVAAL